jgi:hypothetical protein
MLTLPAGAAARVRVLPKPTGAVSGNLTATWTEVLAGEKSTRTDGAITYSVQDRLRAADAAEAWVPQPQPDFVLAQLRGNYAYFLRAQVAVDRFTRTVEDVCDNGETARTTTVVSGLVQPHALLQTTQDPTLNLLARTGGADLRPVDIVVGSGLSEREDVAATGIVATRTTGTDCSGTDEDGLSVPRPVDTQAQMHVGELVGAGVIASLIEAGDASLRIGPGGLLVMSQPDALLYQGTDPENESLTGTWTPNLRFAGPPRSQRALCQLPSKARMARVHTLRGARRLLRRHGFPDVVFVAPRGRRPTRFRLDAPSTYDFCGVTLGTRRRPVLRASA